MKKVCFVLLCLILSCVLPATGSFAWQRDGVYPPYASRVQTKPELKRLTEKQREVHREEGRKRVRERDILKDKSRKSVNRKPKAEANQKPRLMAPRSVVRPRFFSPAFTSEQKWVAGLG